MISKKARSLDCQCLKTTLSIGASNKLVSRHAEASRRPVGDRSVVFQVLQRHFVKTHFTLGVSVCNEVLLEIATVGSVGKTKDTTEASKDPRLLVNRHVIAQ
jgi:hypothetical protein